MNLFDSTQLMFLLLICAWTPCTRQDEDAVPLRQESNEPDEITKELAGVVGKAFRFADQDMRVDLTKRWTSMLLSADVSVDRRRQVLRSFGGCVVRSTYPVEEVYDFAFGGLFRENSKDAPTAIREGLKDGYDLAAKFDEAILADALSTPQLSEEERETLAAQLRRLSQLAADTLASQVSSDDPERLRDEIRLIVQSEIEAYVPVIGNPVSGYMARTISDEQFDVHLGGLRDEITSLGSLGEFRFDGRAEENVIQDLRKFMAVGQIEPGVVNQSSKAKMAVLRVMKSTSWTAPHTYEEIIEIWNRLDAWRKTQVGPMLHEGENHEESGSDPKSLPPTRESIEEEPRVPRHSDASIPTDATRPPVGEQKASPRFFVGVMMVVATAWFLCKALLKSASR